jgi:hypothetical protein
MLDIGEEADCCLICLRISRNRRIGENKADYAEYSHKIIHIIVDDIPFVPPNINITAGQQSKNEEWQRNAIGTGFAKVAHYTVEP